MEATLEQIVGNVFQVMLGLDVLPVAANPSFESDRLLARVHFAGAWRGVLMLEVNPALACFLTGRFLSMDEPASVDDDVRDVLGELVNMIGGNAKAIVTPGASISTPEVINGIEEHPEFAAGSAFAAQAFACEGGVFKIALVPTAVSDGNQAAA